MINNETGKSQFRKLLVLLTLSLFMTKDPAYSDMDSHFNDGAALSGALTQGGVNVARDANQKVNVPQFTLDNQNQYQANQYYGNPGAMGPDAALTLQTHEAGKAVVDSYNTRSQFTIDPNTDPLVKNTEAIASTAAQNYTECKTIEVCTKQGADLKTCTDTIGVQYFTCNSFKVGTPTPISCRISATPLQYAMHLWINDQFLDQKAQITTCYDDSTFRLGVDMEPSNCNGGWQYIKVPAIGDGLWHNLPNFSVDWWCGGCNCKWWWNWWKGGCTNNCAGSTDPNCTESCTYYVAFSYSQFGSTPQVDSSLFPCSSSPGNLCFNKCLVRDRNWNCTSFAETPVAFGSGNSNSVFDRHWATLNFNWTPAHCVLSGQTEDDQCGPYVTKNCRLVNTSCIDQGCKSFAVPCNQICLDCWQWKKTYACTTPGGGTCQDLRGQGCFQTSPGTCVERDQNNVCTSIEYSYKCPVCVETSQVLQCGKDIYCMDGSGNCHGIADPKNRDFSLAASHMGWIDQMAKDFDPNGDIIFRGDVGKCTEDFAQTFKDCCDSHGWLADSCPQDAKELQSKRANSLCHYIGRYCSKKVNLAVGSICIQYTDSYCCFKSKLSRIIHEQGRPQLGIGWGSAENPNCRGFTPQELQQIDFSKIDFSEYYADIQATVPVQTDMAASALQKFQDYYGRMKQ